MPDCTCEKCVNACRRMPGWFAPGEAEQAAALLRMPWSEFRDRYLIREYWIGYPYVYVWTPRKVGVDIGRTEASFSAAFHDAPCVFLDDNGRCTIHATKPLECRMAMPCVDGDASSDNSLRESVVDMWRRTPMPREITG